MLVVQSCPPLCDPMGCTYQAPLSMGFSRQEYWVGTHSLLQGIFPTQGSNTGLPHSRQILSHLSHHGSRSHLSTEIERKMWYCSSNPMSHPRPKEKPQKDGSRGKITFRIKPPTHQRCSEGSSITRVHQDPETPQRLRQNCLSLSCGGTGQQWTAAGGGAGAGALGAADLGIA